MDSNLSFAIAHRHVHQYADAASHVMKEHQHAMDCRDCEAWLASGIRSHNWLALAEETIREADYLGIQQITTEIRDSLEFLCNAWLEPCEFAEQWISALEKHGYTPDNLREFREACEKVRDLLERRDWQRRATTARVLSSEESW